MAMQQQESELIAACQELSRLGARLSLILLHPVKWRPDDSFYWDKVDDGQGSETWNLPYLCRDEFGFSFDPRTVRRVAGFGG